MPVTLTIKKVPDRVANGLRRRAKANHRSLQRELMLIIERVATGEYSQGLPAAVARPTRNRKEQIAKGGHVAPAPIRRGQMIGKLDIEQLWQRARRLGMPMPDESAAIIRHDRDARQRR